MKIFMTGATGYIGGSVAHRLLQEGHQITGLVRTEAGAKELQARGMKTVLGTLDDSPIITNAAREADAVIDTAEANHAGVVEAIASAVRGSGKCFIHTSGSGIVATDAKGERVDAIYDEYSAFTPSFPRMVHRAAIDQTVFDCAKQNVRSVVIRPTMIYGGGHGVRTESAQVPALIENAKQAGIGLHIGRGENLWANVHIDDVVELYVLALRRASAGALYYAENGEEALKNIAASISRMLGFGGRTRLWAPQEAEAALGQKAHSSFGSNSRVRGKRSRAELGWQPKGRPILEEIEKGHYKRLHRSSFQDRMESEKSSVRTDEKTRYAVSHFEKAIVKNPKDAEAYWRMGSLWHLKHQYRKALDCYNSAIELAPTMHEALCRRAYLLSRCPEVELRDASLALRDAKEALGIALSKGEFDTDWKARFYVEALAAAHAAAGDLDAAINIQRCALRFAVTRVANTQVAEELRRLTSLKQGAQ